LKINPLSETGIRARIEAVKKAGLGNALKEEEAKLEKLVEFIKSDWLLDEWLPKGHKGQLTAPEGSFKTIFMIYLDVNIASEFPVFGRLVNRASVDHG
jgi:hypothetical protein